MVKMRVKARVRVEIRSKVRVRVRVRVQPWRAFLDEERRSFCFRNFSFSPCVEDRLGLVLGLG